MLANWETIFNVLVHSNFRVSVMKIGIVNNAAHTLLLHWKYGLIAKLGL